MPKASEGRLALGFRTALLLLGLGLAVVLMNLGILAIHRWNGHLDLAGLERYSGYLPGGSGWLGRFERLSVLVAKLYHWEALIAGAMHTLQLALILGALRYSGVPRFAAVSVTSLSAVLFSIAIYWIFAPSFFLNDMRMFRTDISLGRVDWGLILIFCGFLSLVVAILLAAALGFLVLSFRIFSFWARR